MHVGVLSACMSVHHVCLVPKEVPGKGVRYHRIRIIDCKPPCGCWVLNQDPLEEQLVLLHNEPPLLPLKSFKWTDADHCPFHTALLVDSPTLTLDYKTGPQGQIHFFPFCPFQQDLHSPVLSPTV